MNEQNISVVKEIYDQMLEPKVVVACGICACSGGVFHDCYNVIGGVDQAIPVDVYAPGCAVRPEAIIDAVRRGRGHLGGEARRNEEREGGVSVMAIPAQYQEISVEGLPALSERMQTEGHRFVQVLAVNTEAGIDVQYTFMKDGVLEVVHHQRRHA